jgi:hypothetical protein
VVAGRAGGLAGGTEGGACGVEPPAGLTCAAAWRWRRKACLNHCSCPSAGSGGGRPAACWGRWRDGAGARRAGAQGAGPRGDGADAGRHGGGDEAAAAGGAPLLHGRRQRRARRRRRRAAGGAVSAGSRQGVGGGVGQLLLRLRLRCGGAKRRGYWPSLTLTHAQGPEVSPRCPSLTHALGNARPAQIRREAAAQAAEQASALEAARQRAAAEAADYARKQQQLQVGGGGVLRPPLLRGRRWRYPGRCCSARAARVAPAQGSARPLAVHAGAARRQGAGGRAAGGGKGGAARAAEGDGGEAYQGGGQGWG